MSKAKHGLPSRIKIFGLVYKVKVIRMNPELAGLCDAGNQVIYISEDHKNREEFMKTFLHEVGHAVIHRTGISQAIMSDIVEIVVENYSAALVEGFKITAK